jgi:hypothetical protein
MIRLNKFYFDEDDHGNGCGLAVEFQVSGIVNDVIRNAVVMSKYGNKHTPRETAMALRHLANWCDSIEDHYNLRRGDDER